MVLGPQGVFAKIPGLGEVCKLLTQVLPLGRRAVVERNGKTTSLDAVFRRPFRSAGVARQVDTARGLQKGGRR
jgi:hypothetical protein